MPNNITTLHNGNSMLVMTPRFLAVVLIQFDVHIVLQVREKHFSEMKKKCRDV